MMKNKKNKRKKKNDNTKFKRNKGITLIALVITIIVLLILAGVTIATLTGENGILTNATEAKEETRYATIKEEKDLWELDKLADEQTGSNTAESAEEVINRLYDNGTITEDERDTLLAGKAITVADKQISFGLTLVDMFKLAQAAECTGENCSNAEHLHIGDYVSFKNPSSASASISAEDTGMNAYNGGTQIGEQTFTISSGENQLNWRVLGIDEVTGGLKLISGRPLKSDNDGTPYLYMYGAKSYTTGYDKLNEICKKLYEGQAYVQKARSVNVDDINEITGITTPEEIKRVNLDTGLEYGETYNTRSGYEDWTPEMWLTNKEEGGEISVTVDGYYYSVNSKQTPQTATVSNQRAFELLFDNVEYPNGAQYWLASRGVYAYSDYAGFGPGVVYSGDGVTRVDSGSSMFYSDGNEIVVGAAVRPVVILESEVTSNEIQKTTGTEEDWNYNGGGIIN